MSLGFYIFALILIACALAAYYFFLRTQERGRLAHSLDLVLYSVLMTIEQPSTDPGGHEQPKDQKDLIAVMEQLYASMISLRDSSMFSFLYGEPAFALELALPSVGEEISFFVAVPRKWGSVFEKQINGLFPHAKIERVKDYNMFNSDGVVSGSYLTLKKPGYVPIRTYRRLESDPLGVISAAFSKLKKEGEGAAVQIMCYPASAHYQMRGRDAAKIMRQGKSPEAVAKEHTWSAQAVHALTEIANGSPKPKDKDATTAKPVVFDEVLVKLVEEKSYRAGFDVNIRLLASAPTRQGSDSILKGLEDAFSQFSDPQGNSFVVHSASGKDLQNLVYNFSFRMFDSAQVSYVATEELASLYHFPVGQLAMPKVKSLKAREAALPANMPEEGLLLGENIFRGERSPVRITPDDRRRHLYVVGQTGTGKSNFLESLAIHDIQNGEGVCYIDPHGESIAKILTLIPEYRLDDVVYFNPGETARPLGLNMLEYDPAFPEQKTFVVNELFSLFQKLYGAVPESMGPMFEQYFRNATMLVIDDPSSGSTLLEVARVLSDKAFRELKLSRCNNIIVKNFWRDVAEKAGGEASLANIVPYITSKFDVFLANEIMRPIIAQERSRFNFRSIMDGQKILLINLSKGRQGELNPSLLGLIVVGKLLMAALSRADMSQEARKDFYLYIDEFQNVTTRSIATILSEARKYRLNLTISHQFIGQLEEEIKKAVFGNVGSIAAMRVGTEDAEFLASQFAPVFSAHDLINVDNYQAYVRLLVRGQTSRPFSMHTLPVPIGDPAIAEAIKQYSNMKYGRPREEVEWEISQKHARNS